MLAEHRGGSVAVPMPQATPFDVLRDTGNLTEIDAVLLVARESGVSVSALARVLGRNKSTVSRNTARALRRLRVQALLNAAVSSAGTR